MTDKAILKSIKELCESAVDACKNMYTDNTLGQKQLALKILEKINDQNTKDT